MASAIRRIARTASSCILAQGRTEKLHVPALAKLVQLLFRGNSGFHDLAKFCEEGRSVNTRQDHDQLFRPARP